jgi:tetratricopeptide (TPR) repeat protein
MKNVMLGITIVAMLTAVMPYATAEGGPERAKVDIKVMTAAELEKAGDASRAEKDYAQATRFFQAAIGKNHGSAVLYNKLGIVELQSGNSRQARADFQAATRRDSKYAEAFNNIGAVDLTQKRYGSAARNLKKAIALEESNATFHINLGATWFAENKVDRAVTEYARALELDPEALTKNSRTGTMAQVPPEERGRYNYLIAKLYATRGEVDRCLQCLRKAKEEGYRGLTNVYKDREFASLRSDARLSEVVPPPPNK